MATKNDTQEDREPFLRLDLGAEKDGLDCGCEIRRDPASDDVEVFLCRKHLAGSSGRVAPTPATPSATPTAPTAPTAPADLVDLTGLAKIAKCEPDGLEARIEELIKIEGEAKDAIESLEVFTEEGVASSHIDEVDAHASVAVDLLNERSEGETLGEKMLELCGFTLSEWRLGCYDTYYEARFSPVGFLVDRLRALAPEKLATSGPVFVQSAIPPAWATAQPSPAAPEKRKRPRAPAPAPVPVPESANPMPAAFRERHDRTVTCPHRQISVCPDCEAAHPELVEMFGVFYWVQTPEERKRMQRNPKKGEGRK